MADTTVQRRVEAWVRENAMPRHFRQAFEKKALRLDSGGTFEFDAVSRDERIAACISTAAGITRGGKYPTAKMQKLRSDMYFLLLSNAKMRVVCVTAADMFSLLGKEKVNGRLARPIQILHAALPPELEAELDAARRRASLESKPDGEQTETGPR